MGHGGTERPQLHNEPRTLQTEEQRAARLQAPQGISSGLELPSGQLTGQEPPPTAEASLSFHLAQCQLQFTLMTLIFPFQNEHHL